MNFSGQSSNLRKLLFYNYFSYPLKRFLSKRSPFQNPALAVCIIFARCPTSGEPMIRYSFDNSSTEKKYRGAKSPPFKSPLGPRRACDAFSAAGLPGSAKNGEAVWCVLEPRAGQRGKTNSCSDDLQEESFTLVVLERSRPPLPPRRWIARFWDLCSCQETVFRDQGPEAEDREDPPHRDPDSSPWRCAHAWKGGI